MTLDQLQDLKTWHQRHIRDQPLEKQLFDLVMTFWLVGWVGSPVTLLVHAAWILPPCAMLVFLPGGYVRLRRRLHCNGTLRCDWITALR